MPDEESAVIEHAPEVTVPIHPPAQPADQMTALMRLAVERGSEGVDALERLVQMQERQQDREAKRAYYVAFGAAQAELEPVVRDAYNEQTRSNYARLATVHGTLRPVYTRHGFSVMHTEKPGEAPEGCVRIEARVMHEAGHCEIAVTDVPLDAAGIKGNVNKTKTHAKGSTLTYAIRYVDTLIWAPEYVDADHDGNRPDEGGSREPITEQQAADMEALIEEVSANESAILKWGNVESIADFPAGKYRAAIKRLEEMRS